MNRYYILTRSSKVKVKIVADIIYNELYLNPDVVDNQQILSIRDQLGFSSFPCKKNRSKKSVLNLLYNELTDLGFSCVKPGGTFYIFPKALEEDAVAFCQKALKYDLVLVPSDSFGVPGYFRMAYCIDTEKVERSLTALRKFVKENY